MGVSNKLAGIQPPEGPPVCMAFTSPSGTPPPISSTISLMVIPIGTSIKPLFRILPVRAKIFVPLLVAVPILLYHREPFSIIVAILARVSTLLIRVGLSQSPFWAG